MSSYETSLRVFCLLSLNFPQQLVDFISVSFGAGQVMGSLRSLDVAGYGFISGVGENLYETTAPHTRPFHIMGWYQIHILMQH